MDKCYICNTKMNTQIIEYDNPKWGDTSIRVKEKSTASKCPNCGEIVFSPTEAKRLQELSKHY